MSKLVNIHANLLIENPKILKKSTQNFPWIFEKLSEVSTKTSKGYRRLISFWRTQLSRQFKGSIHIIGYFCAQKNGKTGILIVELNFYLEIIELEHFHAEKPGLKNEK